MNPCRPTLTIGGRYVFIASDLCQNSWPNWLPKRSLVTQGNKSHMARSFLCDRTSFMPAIAQLADYLA